MPELILVLDEGTTSTRAMLFDAAGKPRGVAQQELTQHYPRPGWVEQNPEDWWQAVCGAIRQACSQVPDAPSRVAGVAVSAQAPTLIALDKGGKPLRAALIWMDRRAEVEAVELASLIGFDEVFRITGNRADAYYVAAKLRWLHKREPQVMAQSRQFVQVNGYINYRLTGRYSLVNVHATLLQLRDYHKGEWSAALCEACGVTPDQFPRIGMGHEIMGETTRQAAEATGLRADTPVMVGTVDAAAAALEAGAAEPGVAAEMTGTSTVLLIPNDQSLTDPALIAMSHAVAGLSLLLGATVASGASLRWYCNEFGLEEVRAARQSNSDPFDLITQQAAQIKSGSDGVIFLPYMMGERSPLWHTNARGVLFGLSLSTGKAAVIRAILEGAAFALRHNVEVAEGAGVQINEIRGVGGGARSALWNQIKADVLGVPILLPEASVGAPFGDALLVGLGLGDYRGLAQSVRDMVRIKTRYESDPSNHAKYDQIYPIFRSIYGHLRDDFDHLAMASQ